MEMSFYVGALGAMASRNKLDITSNNLANINNNGFKPKKAVFSELINYNLNDSPEARTELQAGAGTIVSAANTEFATSGWSSTGIGTDYALGNDNTFFMLRDPATGETSFTRDGHFHAGDMGGTFYLMTQSNKYVLGADGNPISASNVLDLTKLTKPLEETTEENGATNETSETEPNTTPGVFTMAYPSRLMNVGDNEFKVREGDTGNAAYAVPNPNLQKGALESSGTDMAKEMTRVIEAQRAYSYALKMVQTSDELESTTNQLRG